MYIFGIISKNPFGKEHGIQEHGLAKENCLQYILAKQVQTDTNFLPVKEKEKMIDKLAILKPHVGPIKSHSWQCMHVRVRLPSHASCLLIKLTREDMIHTRKGIKGSKHTPLCSLPINTKAFN